jgi:F-type H+-transporting ATPase subunit b
MLTRVVPSVVAVLALLGWGLLSLQAFGESQTPSSVHAAAGHADAKHAEPGQEAEGGQPEEAVDPLAFKPDLAVFTGVVFLVLLAILWVFAWGPIVRGLEKREQRIAEEIASAERRNTDARTLLEEYQQKLAASGEEVQQMLERARRDAEQVGQRIVEKARTDAEAEHQRMLGEIEAASDDALKDLARQSATLAVELAGRIVAAKLDPTAHSRLIEQAVAGFSERQPGKRGPSG